MAALHLNVPFRRDIISKVLEDHSSGKNNHLNLLLVSVVLGITCQVARIDSQHLQSIEAPALLQIR